MGFQELVVGGRAESRPAFVPLTGVRRANRPVYRRALSAAELGAGQMRAVEVEGQPVLVANVAGEIYAVRNRCGDSPLPLEFGELVGPELRCSWHRCRYDVRSGARLDRTGGGAPGDRLTVFPVAVREEEIRIAVGVEPTPTG